MPKKLEPDQAFELLKQQPVSQESANPYSDEPPNYDTPNPPAFAPKWLRYTIYLVVTILAMAFFSILIYGGYLLYNQHVATPTPTNSNPGNQITTISPEDANSIIASNLEHFLIATTIDEKIKFIHNSENNQPLLKDYYIKRIQADKALWKILKITPTSYDDKELWMVAYVDVEKNTHHAAFIRHQNDILMHWQSSYAYGEMPWDQFILKQPNTPTQMRAYVTKHTGIYPPSISEDTHICLTIEDSEGLMTQLAVMKLTSKGAQKLAQIPPDARVPVNLKIFYDETNDGNKRLTIQELIHFQWISQSSLSDQHPVMIDPFKL